MTLLQPWNEPWNEDLPALTHDSSFWGFTFLPVPVNQCSGINSIYLGFFSLLGHVLWASHSCKSSLVTSISPALIFTLLVGKLDILFYFLEWCLLLLPCRWCIEKIGWWYVNHTQLSFSLSLRCFPLTPVFGCVLWSTWDFFLSWVQFKWSFTFEQKKKSIRLQYLSRLAFVWLCCAFSSHCDPVCGVWQKGDVHGKKFSWTATLVAAARCKLTLDKTQQSGCRGHIVCVI